MNVQKVIYDYILTVGGNRTAGFLWYNIVIATYYTKTNLKMIIYVILYLLYTNALYRFYKNIYTGIQHDKHFITKYSSKKILMVLKIFYFIFYR